VSQSKVETCTNRVNYLRLFLEAYPLAPSLALWRAVEACSLSDIALAPPVLDLGCGDGSFFSRTFGYEIEAGCDPVIELADMATKRRIYKTVQVADACALPYASRTFQTVFSNCVLEHVPDIDPALKEISRVLTEGGKLVFTVPSERFNDWLFVTWLCNRVGLRSLAEAHLRWFHAIQQHYHIDSISVWEERLGQVGLEVAHWQYYMPFSAGLAFSFLENLWKVPLLFWKPAGVGGAQIVTGRVGRLLTPSWLKRALSKIGERALRQFYLIGTNHNSTGMGLLIQAQKR
jgi:SAM-dependent methyltransferase